MNFSGQDQSAEDYDNLVDWNATVNGSCDATLAYSPIIDGVPIERHEVEHHAMPIQLNDEGLGLSHPWYSGLLTILP